MKSPYIYVCTFLVSVTMLISDLMNLHLQIAKVKGNSLQL